MSETTSIAWMSKEGLWLTHCKVRTHVGTKDHYGFSADIEQAAIGLQLKDVPVDYAVAPIDVTVRRTVEVKMKSGE